MRGYIEEFACTCNVHQKSKALLISSQSDGVKSLWKCLWSLIPDRIWNSEKPCISKDFLALCCTWFHRIGSTPKRGVGGSNPLWDARKHRCKPFFSGFAAFFLFRLLPVISLPLPGDSYTPHDVYLLWRRLLTWYSSYPKLDCFDGGAMLFLIGADHGYCEIKRRTR